MEYLKLGATLVGGGLMGAVLTNIIQAHRNRIQPVRYRAKTTPLFLVGIESTTLKAKVTLTEGGASHELDNLFLTELVVTNTGNQHIKDFTMGITLDGTAQMVNVACDPPDRHHTAAVIKAPTPAERSREVDYTLKPFNRRDVYRFRILSTCFHGEKPGDPKLSSSEGIRFVSSQGLMESLDDAGYSPALEILVKIAANIAGVRIR